MGLWIRSQDRKRLVLNPNLYVVTKANGSSYISESLIGYLGVYKNENRALEIMDDIQKILKGKKFIKLKGDLSPFSMNHLKKAFKTDSIIETPLYEVFNSTNNIIYEMPKE